MSGPPSPIPPPGTLTTTTTIVPLSTQAPPVTPASVVAPATAITSPLPTLTKLSINKLKDGNWSRWKTAIIPILKKKGIWNLVTGLEPRPLDPIAAENWDQRDFIAQGLFIGSIAEDQMQHLAGTINSREQWDALRTMHEPSPYTIHSLMSELYTCKTDDDTNIPAHLSHLKTIRERLFRSGYEVDIDDFKICIVCSLPMSWEAWRTSFLGYTACTAVYQRPIGMHIQELYAVICREYQRRKKQAEESDSVNIAPTSRRAGQSLEKRRCRICERTNHLAAQCRFKGQTKCGLCQRFGHTADACGRANRGKARITKNRDKKKPGKMRKGKERAEIAQFSDSSDDVAKFWLYS